MGIRKDMRNCKENAEYLYDTFAYDTTYRHHKGGDGNAGNGRSIALIAHTCSKQKSQTLAILRIVGGEQFCVVCTTVCIGVMFSRKSQMSEVLKEAECVQTEANEQPRPHYQPYGKLTCAVQTVQVSMQGNNPENTDE
ncbi:hypothetical protein Aduo_004489 [Ancylostoma duodenale]